MKELDMDSHPALKDGDTVIARSEAIKAEYWASGCQRFDAKDAVKKLMAECGELFNETPDAWNFLMEGVTEDREADCKLTGFQHEVAICCDLMLQRDARGQTMAFVRKDGSLVPQVVSADSLDLKNLQQYEMLLFDGGNSAGDTWKHVFFPKQEQHCFVDENPLPRKLPAACNMEASLDGGVTYQPATEGVRIVYKDVMIDGEGGRGEVHVNATHEGLITDIWTTRDEPLDHNIGTDSVLIEDIVSRLVTEND